MKNYIIKAITNWLIDEDIESDDYSIYLFGIYQIVLYVINILTILLIGIAFGELLGMIILVIFFMVIRPYAGGYHASSATKCYLFTNATIIVALSTMKYVQINNIFLMCLLVINSIIIFILAPVDTANKRLDEIEYIVYRSKTVKILGVEIIIAIIMMVIQYQTVVKGIIFAQMILSLALVIGRISDILLV